MQNSKSIHDEEWATGWKSSDEIFQNEERFKIVYNLISGLAPDKIFDIGCGAGYQSKIIKEKLPGIIYNGCDISPAAINRASSRMDSCYVWDIDNKDLPESNTSYDLALCIAVLEHVYDVSHTLNEINRILKPNKHAIIQVPNLSFWRFRIQILMGKIPHILADRRHLHAFNINFLLQFLTASGFSNFQIYGQRKRYKFLTTLSPSFFSENIFVLAKKCS